MITALLLILLSGLSSVFAQDVNFTATAKTAVRVGENFQLNYSINAQGRAYQGPNIQDFQVLSGPNSSSSTQMQIVNGQTTSKVSYIFSYTLRATKEGTFTIPAATIEVNGKKYTSNSLTINVAKGSNVASGDQTQSTNTSDDLFLRAAISNTSPYLGEQTIITYKIYTSIQVSNLEVNKISSFPGFWAKDLHQNLKEFPQSREVINGKEYVVAEVRKFALFPQRSGEITIEPGELNCVAQIQSSTGRKSSDPFFDSFFNDPFFNKRYQNVEKQLFSNSLKVNVKPLPTQNKPADYSGAVGNFSFNSEISETTVKTNEAITLKFTLQGKGNIELIDPPAVIIPPDFEVYDPDIKNNIKATKTGVSGSRTFDYLIIPRNPGDFTIKPVTLSYFDLEKKQYVRLSSPEYKIKVEKGEGHAEAVTYSGLSKEDIQYLGKDIRHIKLPPYQLRNTGAFFFKSDLFFILLVLPFFIAALILIIWRRTVKQRSDIVKMKTKKATKISRKRLKLANKYLKESRENEFYIEISQALWGYLSDKLIIPKAELSMDNVKEILTRKNVNQNIIGQFIETLNNTEYARFAPGNKSENMGKIYHEALDIITKIERELK
ncbi:MAG: BatD family protein [Bacteroidales bacterium]|nr:BatD family protein [Bacteroidales bacterium]